MIFFLKSKNKTDDVEKQKKKKTHIHSHNKNINTHTHIDWMKHDKNNARKNEENRWKKIIIIDKQLFEYHMGHNTW